jgi:hypothetical protein
MLKQAGYLPFAQCMIIQKIVREQFDLFLASV